MWPRAVFDIREGNKLLAELREHLGAPGVYILYRDDRPYYVGKSKRLVRRIWQHANSPKDRYYNFWNYFSAFVVPDSGHIAELEGFLIASMPTENSSVRRIKRIHLPPKIARFIHEQRHLSMLEG
jgi:hypothetical protein